MATYLVTNVSNALQALPKPKIYGLLESMDALHWIRGSGQYNRGKQSGQDSTSP